MIRVPKESYRTVKEHNVCCSKVTYACKYHNRVHDVITNKDTILYKYVSVVTSFYVCKLSNINDSERNSSDGDVKVLVLLGNPNVIVLYFNNTMVM